jgi:hypothetical protein
VGKTTVIREGIRSASSETVVVASAHSFTIIDTEFVEQGLAVLTALAGNVLATFTLTNSEGFSSGVVNNVPTRTFKEGKREFGDLGIVDFGGTHVLIEEVLSFEVGVGRTRTTLVFKGSTLDAVTAPEFLELAGKGFNVKEDVGFSLDDSLLVSGTIGIKEVLEMLESETENVGKFVGSGVNVLKMDEFIRVRGINVTEVEVDGGRDGSSGSGILGAGHGLGNSTVIGFIERSNQNDEITFNTFLSVDSGDGTIAFVLVFGNGDLALKGVLKSEGSLEVVNDNGHKSVLDVSLLFFSTDGKGRVIEDDSEIGSLRVFLLKGGIRLAIASSESSH